MKIDDKYRWLTEKWTWSDRNGYKRRRFKGKLINLHRFIWAIHTKTPYSKVPMLDHINRDREDNRIENLRPTNCTLNSTNREGAGKGVAVKVGKKWRSKLIHRQKHYHIGVFPTERRARLVSRVIKQFLMTLEEAIL